MLREVAKASQARWLSVAGASAGDGPAGGGESAHAAGDTRRVAGGRGLGGRHERGSRVTEAPGRPTLPTAPRGPTPLPQGPPLPQAVWSAPSSPSPCPPARPHLQAAHTQACPLNPPLPIPCTGANSSDRHTGTHTHPSSTSEASPSQSTQAQPQRRGEGPSACPAPRCRWHLRPLAGGRVQGVQGCRGCRRKVTQGEWGGGSVEVSVSGTAFESRGRQKLR